MIDVLQGIPKYAKYEKDVVANKIRLAKHATVGLSEECGSRIQNKLSTKLKDPWSFIVQIKIGQMCGGKRLVQFGRKYQFHAYFMFLKFEYN